MNARGASVACGFSSPRKPRGRFESGSLLSNSSFAAGNVTNPAQELRGVRRRKCERGNSGMRTPGVISAWNGVTVGRDRRQYSGQSADRPPIQIALLGSGAERVEGPQEHTEGSKPGYVPDGRVMARGTCDREPRREQTGYAGYPLGCRCRLPLLEQCQTSPPAGLRTRLMVPAGGVWFRLILPAGPRQSAPATSLRVTAGAPLSPAAAFVRHPEAVFSSVDAAVPPPRKRFAPARRCCRPGVLFGDAAP